MVVVSDKEKEGIKEAIYNSLSSASKEDIQNLIDVGYHRALWFAGLSEREL